MALKEMTGPTAREAEELAQAKTLEKQEQLCRISRALAVLSSASVRPQLCYLFPFLKRPFELYNIDYVLLLLLIYYSSSTPCSQLVGSVKSS